MRLAMPAAARRARRKNSGDAGLDNRTSASLTTCSLAPFCSGGSYPGLVVRGRSQRQCRRMNVVVCAKQIPDPAAPGELDPTTKTLKREGKLILDDSDAYGVEMGLQLADKAGGGEVTLVSMAPNSEVSGLRTALAMGAAKAILGSDDSLKGSDALATAKGLAAAIKRIEPDLVIAATESTDGYTGTLPVQVAELLGLPALTFAKHIEVP